MTLHVYKEQDMTQLLELLQRIKTDPSNPIYLMLLGRYTREDITKALDILGY